MHLTEKLNIHIKTNPDKVKFKELTNIKSMTVNTQLGC